MFWPRGGLLAYKLTILPNLSIIFPNFFTPLCIRLGLPSSFNCRIFFMCVHPSHQPYGYPPFMLCSRHWMHSNPWCNSWHLYRHYVRCWLPRGMKIITCASFNRIQLLSLTSWHHAYQRWYLHFNQHCHCQSNASRFTSLILRNSRICHLWCNSNQRKELSQLTPHWSILPLRNWGI